MEKELVFLSVQPDDLYFTWQIDVQLNNFKTFGYDKLAQVLVFLPFNRIPQGFHPRWKELEAKYPDTKFFYFEDENNIIGTVVKFIEYIPLLRPYCLVKHFENHPKLKDKVIFYHDSDIVFTKYLDFSPFIEDDIHYVSLCSNRNNPDDLGYISARYFDSKINKVKPEALDRYKTLDILQECTNMFGIDRSVAEKFNDDGSGGAQYLLKNIDSTFWENIFDGCVKLRYFLMGINQKFFEGTTPLERENNGFQSWCADMWSILFTLWSRGQSTKCPKELDFAWATDSINRWNEVYIYHDAGAGTTTPHLFYKRKLEYVNNLKTPLEDDLSYISPDSCSYNYVAEILKVK